MHNSFPHVADKHRKLHGNSYSVLQFRKMVHVACANFANPLVHVVCANGETLGNITLSSCAVPLALCWLCHQPKPTN